MPDFEPAQPAPVLTRGYVRALVAGALLLSLYCLLNVLADPTGEFGLSGRFAFNRAPPPAALAKGEAGGNPMFYARAIRESRASVFLMGASRTWRGFDTCARPEVLRLAGDAWGIAELARAQDLVLNSRDRPATVLIEIGLPQKEQARATLQPANAVSVALSPETAWLSAQTIARSIGGHPVSPTLQTCAPYPSPPQDWGQAAQTLRGWLELIDASPASLRRGQLNLRQMIDAADRACIRTGLRHRLIYFSLPATPARSPAHRLDQIIQGNSRAIARLFEHRVPPAGGCDIQYLNFTTVPPGDAAEQSLWRDRGQWSDYAHYSPRLGDVALRVLLGEANR
jgi:hypothetical protein